MKINRTTKYIKLNYFNIILTFKSDHFMSTIYNLIHATQAILFNTYTVKNIDIK